MQDITLPSSICFLPLDIPSFNAKEEVLSQFQGIPKHGYWLEEILLGVREKSKDLSCGKRWESYALKKYPKFIEWVESYFPFKSLAFVRLGRMIKDALPHVDGNDPRKIPASHMRIAPDFHNHLINNEPVGYRFIFEGRRDTLYFTDEYDSTYQSPPEAFKNIKRVYAEIPKGTDAFLVNHNTQPHGVDFNDDKNRIVGFLIGEVDIARHKNLILRSIKKYGRYIQDTKALEDHYSFRPQV